MIIGIIGRLGKSFRENLWQNFMLYALLKAFWLTAHNFTTNQSFKNWPSRPLFHLFSVFLKLTSIPFLQQLMWNISIRYLVLGLKPTTFRTWEESHDHYTRANAHSVNQSASNKQAWRVFTLEICFIGSGPMRKVVLKSLNCTTQWGLKIVCRDFRSLN